MRADKAYTGGRPPRFDKSYKGRNVVERAFNRLKQWRALATRYDKHATNYRGGLLLASLVLWTRENDPGTRPRSTSELARRVSRFGTMAIAEC